MSAPVKTLPSRAEVPVEMTWDLSPLYADEKDWENDFAQVASYPEKLSAFKGKLRRSGKSILAFTKLSEELGLIFGRLSLYASLRADEDTTNDHYKGLKERLRDLGTEIGKARSFFTPEMLSIKPERLAKFVASTPGLEVYKHDFEDMTRLRAHVLSHEVEEAVSTLGRALGAPQSIFGMLTNADWKHPHLIDEDGAEVEMSSGVYSNMLESPNRQIRKAAFEAMFDNFAKFRNTLAATYSSAVTANIARARVRKYPSVLEMSLAQTNLPVSTYNNLIDTVHANLPLIHRYLELRKRMLKVDELQLYDLYVPIAEGVDHSISYKDAQETILAALAPLGEEYVKVLREGYNSRWIDVVESRNKRSGAYQNSVYGSNPYMLMNWQDKIEQMFTLAHESGHAMHSYLSKKNQPYTYSGYTIFLAEMASTTNEALLAHYLLSRTTDRKMRMYILNKQMEGIRTTLVRQTMFAEFERDAHAIAEGGDALTPKVLCALHKGLNEKYYGAVVKIDPRIEVEWSRIPHFYNAFYVYTYATGISVATAMAHMILTEGEPALKRYLKFLSSGSSDYSINILKATGIDLTTPAPIQAAFDSFAEYLAEFEKLAAER